MVPWIVYQARLFIVKKPGVDARVFEDKLNEAVTELQKSYPYLSTREVSSGAVSNRGSR